MTTTKANIRRIIPKCRKIFKIFWKDVNNKRSENYHKFPTSTDSIELFISELKLHRANEEQLKYVCELFRQQIDFYQIPGQFIPDEEIENDEYFSQYKEVDVEELDMDEKDISPEMLEAAEREAESILQTGDPIKYILETTERTHVGDRNTEEAFCISIAGQSCLNTAGIQVSVCGASGSGKSNATKTHLHLVPKKFKREGHLSAKAAFYHELRPGTIIFSDDEMLSPEMEDVVKRSTTNFQQETTLYTVKDQSKKTLKIPARIIWWLTHIDPQASAQLLNRQSVFETEPDHEQDLKVYEMQAKAAEEGFSKDTVDLRVLVCRRIYKRIKEMEPVTVIIPFARRIQLADISNRRIYTQLLDMIKGYTIFKYKQRQRNENGYLIATEEDFERAKKLFESRVENTVTHLTSEEKKVVQFILQHPKCTINEISTATGIDPKKLYRMISGRQECTDSGLLAKVKGLRRDPGENRTNYYSIEGFEAYNYLDAFVTLQEHPLEA